MSFNGYEQINRTVGYSSDNFDFSKTLGQFIGNREFSYGNEDYVKQGLSSNPTAKSYVWHALSAISQDIGEITYSNVRNYIDVVSNVDICKTQALMSMMKNLGMDYTIIDDISEFPYEVLNLIDIFSIDKKYLLDNDKIRDDLVRDIKSHVIDSRHGELSAKQYYKTFQNWFRLDQHGMAKPGELSLAIDNGYDADEFKQYKHVIDLVLAGVYDNQESAVLYREYRMLSGTGEIQYGIKKVGIPVFSIANEICAYEDQYRIISGGYTVCSANANEFEERILPGGSYVTMWPEQERPISVKYIQPDEFSVSYDTINDALYVDYVKSVFKELLSSYLVMRYNVEGIDSLSDVGPIYHYIKNEYQLNSKYYTQEFNSDMAAFKRKNDIPLSFDESDIVDAVDAGRDSLDNYSGVELQLLDLEIQRRARRLTYSDVNGDASSYYSKSVISADDYNDTSKNKTRYSYYRKAKVLEYARFIDNVFALGSLGTSAVVDQQVPYEFDFDKYDIRGNAVSSIFIYDGEYRINEDELDSAVESVTRIVQYIARLRNKIKLQIRKNYMKGTNNLLTYLINEFLVDYSRTNRIFDEYSGSQPLVADIRKSLSASDIDDIEVIEYDDNTEYFNLSSARSVESVSKDYNTDFKSQYFKNTSGGLSVSDGKTFTADQIREFYLSSLGLRNSISDDTAGFAGFLNTIFDIGRHDSYIGKNGIFACRLDDGRYTSDMYDKLVQVSGTYGQYKQYLSAGDYEYPADTVANQLTDVIDNYVGKNLSDKYMVGVSDVYDAHCEEILQISSDFIQLSSDYNSMLSGGYKLYLNKSQCKYCYTDGEMQLTQYKHDWYIGNSDKYNAQYLIDKVGELKGFTENRDNMKCYPVLDTLEYARGEFVSISSNLMSNVEAEAEKYGYVDIMSPFLDEEMNSIYQFLDQQQSYRQNELQTTLASIKERAASLKVTYDRLDNTFDQVMANYDTGDNTIMGQIEQNFFGKCEDSEHDGKRYRKSDLPYDDFIKKNKKKIEDGKFEYDENGNIQIIKGTLIQNKQQKEEGSTKTQKNVTFFRYDGDKDYGDKNKYDRFFVNAEFGTDSCAIDKEDSLETKISKTQAWMGQITDGHIEPYIAEDPEDSEDSEDESEQISGCYIADPEYGYANAGVLASVNSIEADLKDLNGTIDSVIDQIRKIGGSFSKGDTVKKIIDDLIKYVESDLDANFLDDERVKKYTDLKKQIAALSAQFTKLKYVYDGMPKNSEYKDYIAEAYNPDFTVENMDSLSAYSVDRDVAAKTEILQKIGQIIDKYNSRQNLYTAIIQQIEAETEHSGALQPDQYLELELEYAMKCMKLDIEYRTQAANEKIDAEKRGFQGYVNILSTCIEPDLSASDENFEYYMDKYLAGMNFFDDPVYISSYELFKTYGGTSSCYDPYYNYKNLVHPSYQVHPFLWNFVESAKVHEIVSRSFDGLINEKLERLQIRKYIDGIIGEFGQVVNIWQNNTVDCAGYTTRYEVNSHTDENTEYSPVVDYDGGFYPPAVKYYVSNRWQAVRSVLSAADTTSISQNVKKAVYGYALSSMTAEDIYRVTSSCVEPFYADSGYTRVLSDFVIRYSVQLSSGLCVLNATRDDLKLAVQEGLSPTFYQDYYQHLHLDGDTNQRTYIAGQLSCDEIYARISAIAEDKSSLSDVYDIYRYGLDYGKNVYVLYKAYGKPNPSYKERRSTPGALWIRRKNHPIAFPAILDSSLSVSRYQQCYRYDEMNSYLLSCCDGTLPKFIGVDSYCYDFQFSKDQAAIAMACVNPYAVDPIFRSYDYPAMVMSIIEDKSDSVVEKRKILCFSNNAGEADDIIAVSDWVPSVARIMQGDTLSCPAFLGAYSPSEKNIRLVYAFKSHRKLEDSLLSVWLGGSPAVMIAQYDENTNGIGVGWNACQMTCLTGVSRYDVTSHEIAFTCEDVSEEKLAFAFPVAYRHNTFETYNGVTVDVSANAEGGLIDDPGADEMTSHDVFDEHIAVVRAYFNSGLYQSSAPTLYNLNADISYQPVYPGYQHAYSNYALSGYQAIQLLGKSKDISKSIAGVNVSADPYFDLSTIMQNGVYGRVYENYNDVSADILNRTFVVRSSPCFSENSPDQSLRPTKQDKRYEWQIDLQAMSVSDLPGLNFVMFNTQNMGKNPYFIGKVQDAALPSGEWVRAYYNSPESERECVISSDDVGKYTITGINRQGYTNSTDNNRIHNISGIRLRFDVQSRMLYVCFDYLNANDSAHIPADTVRCVFYNDKNLEQFQYYHMLDSYGAVNAYELIRNKKAYDYVIQGDGWTITYDTSKYDEKFRDKIKSFILDKDGARTYLEDIDLSQYSFLSDVYVYRDNRLAFKYNEEDMFEYVHREYHYPFLNRCYPSTIAQYYAQNMNFSVKSQSESEDQLNLFDETNVFVIRYAEGTRILSSMGRVAVPVLDTEDGICLRAYEDYLSVYQEDTAGGQISGYNCNRYGVDDPRVFQFAHFFAVENAFKTGISADTQVPDSYWDGKTNDEFCAAVLSGFDGLDYIPARSQPASGQVVKYVYVTPSPENCDISELLNIQANYRKEKDGSLTLFFNYANYVNTPFVKFEGGKFKIDTIDRTYLMLKSGEAGELDVVVQVRYYVGEDLCGYRNVKVLTFKIHNLSDDKPKFYITKTYELLPNSLDIEQAGSSVSLGIAPTVIDIDRLTPAERQNPVRCQVSCTIGSDWRISQKSTAQIVYPAYMISPVVDGQYVGYSVEEQSAGVACVKFSDPDITEFAVKFDTVKNGSQMVEYANRRYAISYGDIRIYDTNGRLMDASPALGSFMIKNSGNYLLADEGKTPVVDGVNNMIYAHNV